MKDRKPRPNRVWNRISDEIRDKVIERALEEPELSPREVAVAFTDAEKTFVSEASVYRILKAEGLVTSPAFIVMKAAEAFANPTTAINQLSQTDFTYLRVTGWGWIYLSTVLDDFSGYIVAWKLCTTMSAADVTATLELALRASGLDDAEVDRRRRLLSDNGPSYIASDLSNWLEEQGMRHTRGKPYHPMTQCKIERWHLSLKSRILLENYYLPATSSAPLPASSKLQSPPLSREPGQPYPGCRLLRTRHSHPETTPGDQATDHRAKAPTAHQRSSMSLQPHGPDFS